jgi:hypothetical protein
MRRVWTGLFLLASVVLAAAAHSRAPADPQADSPSITDGTADHPAIVRPLLIARPLYVAPVVKSGLLIFLAPPSPVAREGVSLLPPHLCCGPTSVNKRGPPALI